MIKNIFFSFVALSSISFSSLFANPNDLADIVRSEMKNADFSVERRAKFVETYLVQYVTASDGSLLHIAKWTDCVIGTVIANSPNVGTQVILLPDGTLFDASDDYKVHSKYYEHRYVWGKIYTYDHKQVIEK